MWRRYIWIALGIAFLWLRFQNIPGVLTEQGVVLNDTDPYYRLHRIAKMVETDLTYPLHDDQLSHPQGFEVPWPLGLDMLIAAPLKTLGVSEPSTMEVFAALAIPFLALPALWFLGSATSLTFGSGVALGAGFLFTVSAPAIYSAAVGRVDHHFLEGLLVALGFWLLTIFRRRHRWSFLGLVGLLGLAPSFWPQAWILGLFLTASFLMDRDDTNRSQAGKLFFFASLLSLIPLAFTHRFGQGTLSLFGFSWWSPFLYSILAAGFFLLQAFSQAQGKSRILAGVVWSYTLMVLAWLLTRGGLDAFHSTKGQAYQVITASQGLLALTNEAISPLRLHPGTWLALGLGPLFLAWLWFALQAFNRNRWWMVGYFVGPLILAFLQARFVGLATPVMAIATAHLVYELLRRRVSSPLRRRICFIALLGLLVFPAMPNLGWTQRENTHPLYRPIRSLAGFLTQERERPAYPSSHSGIAAHWDFGHWLLKYADSPVVAHPFQGSASWDTLQMFCSESEADFHAYMEQHPVRYLAVEGPNRRVRKWLRSLGRDLDRYFIPQVDDQGKNFLLASNETLKLQILRFFIRHGQNSEGLFPPDWRLLYVSPFANPDDPSMPALKLFERVPGATLQGRTKAKTLRVEGRIQFLNQVFYFSQTAHADEQGLIRWQVPYAQTNRGNVQFSGHYTLHHENGQSQTLPMVILEQDIYQAKRVDLGNLPW